MMEKSLSYSFGETLRAFRKRRGLTQQQVAEKLHVHRQTIGGWERGDVLPDSRGMVLELARVLRLGDQETRQLLEASLTALAPYWSLPYLRNPFFTGREEILEELHACLRPDQAVALTQSYAMSGLGGIGKTQIAVEYAYRHALAYSAVFWVGAETVETIVSGALNIAEVLKLPERHEAEEPRVVIAVQRWLSTHKDWLLIWDNVEDLKLLSHFLPAVRQGAVLMTTRRQALGTLAQGIEVGVMEPEEGVLLLLRRAKVVGLLPPADQLDHVAQHLHTDYAAAQRLVMVLGGLPLALDQAGAYIEETGCSLPDYLQRYEKQQGQFLHRRGILAHDHPQSVAATVLLALERVACVCPAAADLLRVCAFLHADEIPEELLLIGSPYLGPTLASLAADPSQLDLTATVLRAFSLLQRDPETRSYSLHRLVQAVLREGMDTPTTRSWIERVVCAMNAAFPEAATFEHWQRCERLMTHAQMCQQWIKQAGIISPEAARLLHEAGGYQIERGYYAEAQSFLTQAVALRERTYGLDHPHVAMTQDRLAWCYECQGNYEQAELLYQRALTICEACLGPGDPFTADLLNNLGNLLQKKGRYEQAESLLQRAVILGEHHGHPETATYLSNLARIARGQGKYEQAESLLQRVLALREQQLGPTHPQIATCLHNLATLSKDQGNYEQAESLGLRALAMYEQQLGPTHPHTAVCLYNLAELVRIQGYDRQAEPLFQRVLAIEQQRLGASHPSTATTLQSLAKLYLSQGKYDQAESLFQQVVSVRVEQLGTDHHDTAESFHCLATLYEKQGLDEQAISLFQRALAIREQQLGNGHPQTVQAKNDYERMRERKNKGVQGLADQSLLHLPESSSQPFHAPEASPEAGHISTAEQESDPLAAFLASCCELHPHAWSRSHDLWQAYACWAKERQERYPLSRRAFSAQLKAHGCRADRTNTARIWRGIGIVNPNRDEK